MSGVLSNQAVQHLADKATDERDIGYGEVLRLTASREALRAERDALAARLADAEKDAARLDAIVANEWFIADEETDPLNGDPADEVFDGHRFAVLSNKGGCVGRGDTARAAIDDAIEQISVSKATP